MDLRSNLRLHAAHNHVSEQSCIDDLMPNDYYGIPYSNVEPIQIVSRDDTVRLATQDVVDPVRLFATRLSLA
jgi:hypothetical protein